MSNKQTEERFNSMSASEKELLKNKVLQIMDYINDQLSLVDTTEKRFSFCIGFGDYNVSWYTGNKLYHWEFYVEKKENGTIEFGGHTGGLHIQFEGKKEYMSDFAWDWAYGLGLLENWQYIKREFLSKIDKVRNNRNFINSFEI